MNNASSTNKWVIPNFSSIIDEVCSEDFDFKDYYIKFSAKNFKYLFFPFNIVAKLGFNSPSKKKKTIKANLQICIRNKNATNNLIISEEAVFKSPNYEYVIKTPLAQEDISKNENGWVNSDKIKIYFKIEFIKPHYYHYDTCKYDEEESEDEKFSQEESETENDFEEIVGKNYYDFKIYDYNTEKSPTLKFNNFQINLSAYVQQDSPAINFQFISRKKMKIIFAFKLINFGDQEYFCPMQKILIRSKNLYSSNSFIKEETIIFPISIDDIYNENLGWKHKDDYSVIHVHFYLPNDHEDLFQEYSPKPHLYFHCNRSYNYNTIYHNSSNNNNNNRIIYRDTSKEDTGCVGLQNQGATCYMNSLLQSLFHIPAFRKIVYNMPTNGQEDIKTSIPLCLQRLFAKLQFSTESCSTKELTTSFGWNDHETFIQHDVQEFCTVLIDKLSEKMKGTPLENSLSALLGGKFKSYIRCVNVDFESSKIEDFFDLSMIVKGCEDLQKSFQTYVEPEHLDGDNQYKTDKYGPQDAMMGTEFIQFPPVLHIHLRRFQFDYQTMRMTKINDKFEFPLSIDLQPFMANDQSCQSSQNIQNSNENENSNENANKNENDDENENNNENENKNNDGNEKICSDYVYDLYGVLVHSGSISGGHYFAFLRTSTSQQWYKFNDSSVTKATKSEAVDDNFGGTSETYYSEKSYSAYMLVYIRRNEADKIMKPVAEEEVPSYLIKYAKGSPSSSNSNESENKTDVEEVKSIEITIYPEDGININSILGKSDFFVSKLVKKIKVPNILSIPVDEENKENTKIVKLNHKLVYDRISQELEIDRNSFRLWLFLNTPYLVYQDDNTEISSNELKFFIQHKSPESEVDITKYSSQGIRNIIFIKFFHPSLEFPFNYLGTRELSKDDPVSTLFPYVRERIGLNENDELIVFKQNPSFYQSLDPSSLCNIQSQTLVFQLKPGLPLPENTNLQQILLQDVISMNIFQYLDEKSLAEFELEHGIKINLNNSNKDKAENEKDSNSKNDNDKDNYIFNSIGFPFYKYNQVMNVSLFQTVEEYSASKKETIYANLYDYDEPYLNPISRIAFQSTITLNDLKSFIAFILQCQKGIDMSYENSIYAPLFNTIQIFKSVNKSPKSREPSGKPIILHQGVPNLSMEFPYNNGYCVDNDHCQNIFVQYIPGTPEITSENQIFNVTTLFSNDGIRIVNYKVFRFLNENTDMPGELVYKILLMVLGVQDDEALMPIEKNNYNSNNDINNESDTTEVSITIVEPDESGPNNDLFIRQANNEVHDLFDDENNVNENVISSNTNESNDEISKDESSDSDLSAIFKNIKSFGFGNRARKSTYNDEEAKEQTVHHYDSEIYQNTNSENQNTNSENQNTNNESQNINSENQNTNSESQNINSENQNINNESQNVNNENQNANNEGQNMNNENQNINNENQNNSPENNSPVFVFPNEIAGIPINHIRVLLIKNHVIRQSLPLDFQIKENTIIRFDIVSDEDLISLQNGASLIPVSHISDEDGLPFGDPFLITVKMEDKFELIKKKLNDILVGANGMTNQEFMHLAFFFGDADHPEYQKKFLWKDMNVLDELKSRYSAQNTVLYILHRSKKTNDMSVKIYN